MPPPQKQSWPAAILGLLCTAGGGWVLIFPSEADVLHSRAKHLQSFTEHVSLAMVQVYGATILLLGLALIAISVLNSRD
jgi:hypothetical protein